MGGGFGCMTAGQDSLVSGCDLPKIPLSVRLRTVAELDGKSGRQQRSLQQQRHILWIVPA
jgi:hypothetical protein